MNRRFLLLSLVILFVGLMGHSPALSAEPTYGGSLVVAMSANPDGLDPHRNVAAAAFEVTCNIYDTLVAVDPESRLLPGLARDWEVSDDGLQWTFYLEEGILFHNGREMIAADVVHSFERLMDEKSPRAKDYAVVEKMETPDDYTVIFTLKEPLAAFLSNLAYEWAAIVPQEEADNLNLNPVGSGPFRFVEWVQDSHVKLVRFEDYFRPGVPYLDEATFKIIPEEATRMVALQTGEVDVVDNVPPQEVAALEENPDFQVVKEPYNGLQLLAINNDRPPFDDVRVRQAINYAVDKQAVIEGAQWGYGLPIGSHMPPVSEYYVDLNDTYPYDPDKARELLAEAGYPDGFETTIILPQPYGFHIRNGEVVAAQLAEVGVTANLETLEWGTYLDQVYFGRDYALTTLGHTGRLDPDPFLNRYVSDSKEDYMNYDDPRYDELAQEGAVSTDQERRKEIYAEMQRLLAEDAVAVYLLAPLTSIGLRRDVHGWQVYPIDVYDLRTVYRE